MLNGGGTMKESLAEFSKRICDTNGMTTPQAIVFKQVKLDGQMKELREMR